MRDLGSVVPNSSSYFDYDFMIYSMKKLVYNEKLPDGQMLQTWQMDICPQTSWDTDKTGQSSLKASFHTLWCILISMDMSLSKLWELVMEREAWRPAVGWVTKSRTRLRDWTELNSAYKVNNQSWQYTAWHTPFPSWNQSIVPCPVLTVASWPAYRFCRRQVRWSGIPISLSLAFPNSSTVCCDPHSQRLWHSQ